MEVLFLIGRILYGGFFIMNGLNHFLKSEALKGYAATKGVKPFWVYFSGLLILLGGLGILLGVYVQLAVLFIAVFLIAVSFIMHNYWRDTDPNMKMSDMVNFMKNMALLGAALALLAIPTPWSYSLGI